MAALSPIALGFGRFIGYLQAVRESCKEDAGFGEVIAIWIVVPARDANFWLVAG
jgi:hypothetical protein